MITFTPGTANEWGAELAMAMRYLQMEGRGVDEVVLMGFRASLFTAKTRGLVELGRLLGSPVLSVGIDPAGGREDGETRRRGDAESGAADESFFVETPLARHGASDESSVGNGSGTLNDQGLKEEAA